MGAAGRRVVGLRARALLRRCGVESAALPRFPDGLPRLTVAGRLRLGRGVVIRSGRHAPVVLVVEPGATLEIGDGAFLNHGVGIHAARHVVLGAHVRLANRVSVNDTNFHPVDQDAEVRVAPVHIGDNAWLGQDTLVLPGVTIGEHTVVAAGSVVSRSLPDRVVAAGNPAVPVRALRAEEGWVRP